MREILFRGKRCDGGGWVYGYYVKAKYHFHEKGIHEDWIICGAAANGGYFALHSRFPVQSDSVGQFTGCLDMNGAKIFEGDYVASRKIYLSHLGYVNNGFETMEQAKKYRDLKTVAAVTFKGPGDVGSCGCCYASFAGSGFHAEDIDLDACEIVGNQTDGPNGEWAELWPAGETKRKG